MVAVQFTVPRKGSTGVAPSKVDVLGGVLLAVALGLTVVGLYNPDPQDQALPGWALPVLSGAGAGFLAFRVWGWFARTKLIHPAGVRLRPFLAAPRVRPAAA